MSTRRVLCLLTALLLWLGMPAGAFAETIPAETDGALPESRSIYVGDIITLEIAAGSMSAEAIREAFGDFEIMALKETSKGFLLSLRTFETGAHAARIGDKEIVIHVASTLEDIDRDGVFEGGTEVLGPGFSFPWRVLFYVVAGVCILSGGFVLVRFALRRKAKAPLPYPLFLRRAGALSAQSDRYLVDLTHAFKAYIEGLYPCPVLGKTTAETLRALKGIAPLKATLPDIQAWLTECDRLKFTGVQASEKQKQAHGDALLALAAQIHARSAEQSADTRKEGEAS